MTERIGAQAWVLWRSFVLQLRETARSPMAFVVSVVQPAVFLGLLLLARSTTDPAFATRATAGAMALGLWSISLWSTGSILHREIAYGTMAAILSRPVSLMTVLVGKSFGVALFGLGAVTAATTAVLIVTEAPIAGHGPAAMLLIAVLATVSAATLGTLLSSLLLLTRGSPRVIEALIYPVFVLGGLLVPTGLLPEFLRWPAYLISLHFVVEMSGDQGPDVVATAWVVGLCGLYLAVGSSVIGAVLRRVRGKGTLEFY